MLGIFGGGDVEVAGAGVGVDLDLRLLRVARNDAIG